MAELDTYCGKPVEEMSREELIEQLDVTHSLMMTALMVAGKAQRQLDRYRGRGKWKGRRHA